MKKVTSMAKTKAMSVVTYGLETIIAPTWVLVMVPAPKIITANAAAWEMPRVKGDPNGLRRVDCITAPLTERPAPATTAARTWGSRICQMMMSNRFDVPMPARARATSITGMGAAPRERLYQLIKVGTNARIITATHHNLEKLVKKGRFREDLYYRINVVKISLPALAARKEDIALLTHHFIEQFNHHTGKHIAGISHKAMAALMLDDWPGNIRGNWKMPLNTPLCFARRR